MSLLWLMLQEGKGKQRMQAFTDRLSCACFGLANTVTIMFYTVENATKVGTYTLGLHKGLTVP